LNEIEQIVNVTNLDDSMIVKKIRDCLGLMVSKAPFEKPSILQEDTQNDFMQEEAPLNEGQVAFALIEGESI